MRRCWPWSSLGALAVITVGIAACEAARPIPGVAVTIPSPQTTTPRPTHTPGWWETTTPTGTLTVTATAIITGTPTPTPLPWRETLAGRIVFVSDRDGWQGTLYITDVDGANQEPLQVPGDDFFGSSGERFYRQEIQRQRWNSAHTWRVFVSASSGGGPQISVVNEDPQDPDRGGTWDLTFHGAGIAYDPAWQPNGNWIVYVSNDSGNDEIWKIHAHQGRGSEVQLTDNSWQWDKFPSWSPDGTRIVFYSNRDGPAQIYVMNADGSNQRNISNNPYHDKNPVWIRSLLTPTLTMTPTLTETP